MTTRKFLSGTLFIAACACTGTSTLGNGEESGGGLETMLREACAELLACGPNSKEPYSQTECEADIRAGRDQAIAEGCGDLWDAVGACAMENPGSCGDEGYVMSPACDAHETARQDCMGQTSCSGGGSLNHNTGEVACYESCDNYSAECRGRPGGPVSCSCTSGVAAGWTFEIDNCESGQISTVARVECE